MKPINNSILAVSLTIAFSIAPSNVQAQMKNLQEKMKNYFPQTLETKQNVEQQGKEAFQRNKTYAVDIWQLVKNKDIAQGQEIVWAAWYEANRELGEWELAKPEDLRKGIKASWDLPGTLGKNAIMPYYYGIKESAAGKLPLFLYLHGSGPKEHGWVTGFILGDRFQDGPSLYFIPQIPNKGDYYRWWQVAEQFAWEKLIRQVLVEGNVDASRLYVFDIPEGSYGNQRLASFYADYWAAAGPMAGDKPLKNTPIENCANIDFLFPAGADDTGFYRNILAYYMQIAFNSAQLARPLDADKRLLFVYHTNLLPNMQRHIKYDLTTPQFKSFVRDPCPKTVLWEDYGMDGRYRSGFYNLQVLTSPTKDRTYYDMNIHNNVVKINIKGVEYTAAEKDKHWGIEVRFNRSCTNARGGRLHIYLNSELIDMNKSVTAIVNGKKLYRKNVKANLRDVINNCVEYFGPYRVFPASTEVNY